MPLEPYTNTYVDIDGNIFDSDDLVNEFNRVAQYINTWAASVESIGTTNFYEETILFEQTVIIGSPSFGIIQKMDINEDAESVVINFIERETGDPYRIYMTLRFRSPDTTFTVSGPAAETHAFGLNRGSYSPSQQVSASGFYTAVVVATYGDANGVLINVYADNTEATDVETDDLLTAVAQ